MGEAEDTSSKVLEPDSDSDSEGSAGRHLKPSPAVSEHDLYPLVSAAKKARAAGSTAAKVT